MRVCLLIFLIHLRAHVFSKSNRLSTGRRNPLVDSPTTPRRTVVNLLDLIGQNTNINMVKSKQTSTSTTGLLQSDSKEDSFLAPDDEMIRRATKSRSKTGTSQNKGQAAQPTDSTRQPIGAKAKELASLNEFGKLLNGQTKELMAKIEQNYESLNSNQADLSKLLEIIEKSHEVRANAMEQRLNAMETSLKRYEICETKIASMADLIDARMKEIYDANKRFDGIFRDVAKENSYHKN